MLSHHHTHPQERKKPQPSIARAASAEHCNSSSLFPVDSIARSSSTFEVEVEQFLACKAKKNTILSEVRTASRARHRPPTAGKPNQLWCGEDWAGPASFPTRPFWRLQNPGLRSRPTVSLLSQYPPHPDPTSIHPSPRDSSDGTEERLSFTKSSFQTIGTH